MKLISARLALALLVFAASVWAQSKSALTDKGWPRTFTSGATAFAVYQPQIEQWQDNKFSARAAVAVTAAQNKQPTYGVIWFNARTEIDKLNRLVTMTDFVITKANFPASPERAAALQSALQTQAPKVGQVIALDRLLAELAIAQNRQTSAGHQLKNDPPHILFSTRPAILVLIDGEPALLAVKDTRLKRIINTRVLLVRDETRGRYYLHLLDGWMEADALNGPWSVAFATPSELRKVLETAEAAGQVDLLDGASNPRPSLSASMQQNALPAIYVSTAPTELLQSQGEPQFAPIAGTQLLYVTNSENDIFVETSAQERYVLIAGRWFRAKSMAGPWTYVEHLPADFSISATNLSGASASTRSVQALSLSRVTN